MAKSNKHPFAVGDYIVCPKHGVGRITELEVQEIAGLKLELYVIRFEKERMTLRVPTGKAEASGMRRLSNDATLKDGLGPPGRRIKSENGNAVMFAEVSYKHTPLFLNGFIKERTIRYETAFNVRDSSNRTISNTQNLAVMSC